VRFCPERSDEHIAGKEIGLSDRGHYDLRSSVQINGESISLALNLDVHINQ
jgi:hypothetical protein